MRSTPTSHHQITMGLILLNVNIMKSNALHITFNILIIYKCPVNILCEVATVMLFRSAIPLTVWRAPCGSKFDTFDVKLSVITVCLPVNFEFSGPRNLLKPICAIDRLRLCKHCYHYVSSSCLVSIGDFPSSTQRCLYVRCSALSPKPLFNSDQFPLNARCFFIVWVNI